MQGQPPPQQQQPPQSYPGGYPAATPSATPYHIPPPSNSGSLDLSNIKPVNSGSVSFNDAVAKARGIAAERGVSYDMGRANGSKIVPPQIRRCTTSYLCFTSTMLTVAVF